MKDKTKTPERLQMDMSSTKEKKVVSRKKFEEIKKQQRRRKRITCTVLGVLALLLILVLGYTLGIYEKMLDAMGIKRDISVTPTLTTIEYAPRGEYVIGAVADSIILCDENGVTGLDRDGVWKWNVHCTIENPLMRCEESFVLLSEYGGKCVWAFDGNGQRFRYDSELPIIGAFAGDSGETLMVLCKQSEFETSATYLTCKDGLLQEVFTRKFGTYHMIAGAQSQNPDFLALSGVYSSGGAMTGAVVFMRTRDGEVISTAVTEGQVYPILTYLNKDTVFAVNGESLRLLRKAGTATSDKDIDKELWSAGGGRLAIADAVCVNGKYCVVAYREENVEESSRTISSLIYYNSAGKEKHRVEVDGRIEHVLSFGNTVLVYTENCVYMYNETGNYIGTQEFSSKIRTVSYLDDRTAMVACQDGLYRVSFEG
ncbi:MAG: hypothetical protein IKU26_06650 [Clostridia bacterium]|nr:hypothetical protein [Clostridia bacterium]